MARGRPARQPRVNEPQPGENESAPQPNLLEVVAQLQRQVAEQQQVIASLTANQQASPVVPPKVKMVTPTIAEAPSITPVAPSKVVRQEAYLSLIHI